MNKHNTNETDFLTIHAGQYEVLATGTVLVKKEEVIEFNFKNFSTLTVKIEYRLNNELGHGSVKAESISKGKIKLIFQRPYNSIPFPSKYHLPFGKYGKRKLLLSYDMTFTDDGVGMVFNYTWHLGEEVHDDK